MNEMQMLNNVKETLAGKLFQSVRALLVNGDIVLRDETRRAQLPYPQAIQAIEVAEDVAVLWVALHAAGVVRLRPRRSDNTPDPEDID